MPGAQITEQLDDTHFKGTVKSKVGPAVMSFGGDIELLQLDTAARTLQMLGKGADKAGSSASMNLTATVLPGETPGSSVLAGQATITVSGKLAQFGSRLLVPVSDAMLTQFAGNFRNAAAAVPVAAAPAGTRCSPRTGGGGGRAGARGAGEGAQRPRPDVDRHQGLVRRPVRQEGMNDGALRERLQQAGYIADEALATTLWLAGELQRPLLIEGDAGVGKTALALALAKAGDRRLVRLQCHEGLDLAQAAYEWNYGRQLLAIRLHESATRKRVAEADLFARDYLLERPLLQAIASEQPCVLLIDELDRADEAFEAFLLEVLSDWQITVPELGTLTARHVPQVILTSNGTRELSDALRRRCLYHWLDYPTLAREIAIVRATLPQAESALVEAVRGLRAAPAARRPGQDPGCGRDAGLGACPAPPAVQGAARRPGRPDGHAGLSAEDARRPFPARARARAEADRRPPSAAWPKNA